MCYWQSSWFAPAKLNLFLYITGQRNDGYHTLQTLIQFLNYGDNIKITPRNDKNINLIILPKETILDKKNLIINTVNLLMDTSSKVGYLSSKKGVNIIIEKRIPIGSGLGGGSSDAATILVALNKLWNCGLNKEELLKLGLKIGTDVPFFLYGCAAFVEGIGEVLSPVSFLEEKWYLIIYPGISIATKFIFSDPELTRNTPKRPLNILLGCEFKNDCEIVVKKHFNEVKLAYSWLLKYAPAYMTGTGSCVFAKFNTKLSAIQVLKQAPKWLSGFVVKGMNLSPLRVKD